MPTPSKPAAPPNNLPSAAQDAAPKPIPGRAVPEDTGLADWGRLIADRLNAEAGVEISAKPGGSIIFKFRGQSFLVTVQRVG